jgi:hypothetical protein
VPCTDQSDRADHVTHRTERRAYIPDRGHAGHGSRHSELGFTAPGSRREQGSARANSSGTRKILLLRISSFLRGDPCWIVRLVCSERTEALLLFSVRLPRLSSCPCRLGFRSGAVMIRFRIILRCLIWWPHGSVAEFWRRFVFAWMIACASVDSRLG